MGQKTIGITGGTGFVGQYIAQRLAGLGHRVIVFSRSEQPSVGSIQYARWQPDKAQIDAVALSQVDAIIHLAGAAVAEKRWSARRKEEIRRSRVEPTLFLHKAILASAPNCRSFIAASATGYYGPDRKGLSPFKEDAPPYNDFLGNVCKDWEQATFSNVDRLRTVALRVGIVLGKEGGAYPELSAPMRFGIMPILGNGSQVVSWIHVEDLARLFIEAAMNEHYKGVYNAVAPHPVSHKVLMKAIAKAKGGIKVHVPVPAFVLRTLIGEASIEVLKSCTVSDEKLRKAGSNCSFQTIEQAAAALAR